MADSTISITAGSGINIDTRTESTNSHHRQVIVIGDPSTNAGVAPVDATSGLKVDLGADNDITVDILSIAAGTNLIGDVGIQGRTTGGALVYNNTDVQETDSEIKGTGGTVYTIYAWNMTAAPLWLKFYNATAANVTPGTTAPDFDLMIPANADSDGAGFVIPLPPQGINFATAITISGSTTRGTTAADVGTAGNLGVFIAYK